MLISVYFFASGGVSLEFRHMALPYLRAEIGAAADMQRHCTESRKRPVLIRVTL